MSPKKNMQYSAAQLAAALESIRKGNKIRLVSRTSGIPESTLRGKLSGRYKHETPGAPTVLPAYVEKYAEDWILDEASRGFSVNTARLKASVAHFVRKGEIQTNFKNGVPGNKWVKHYLRRHPKVARRIPSTLAKHRAIVTEGQIRKWFAEIHTFIREDKLEQVLKDPSRVFNMDETAVRTIPTKEVVLAGTGTRHLHVRVENSDKESYTALFGANALGILAPTLILYPYKQRIPGEIFRKLPKNWAAGRTPSGWMIQDSWYKYLRDVFHPWLVKEKITLPVIVFVDGHRSHVSPLTTEMCKELGIILICLSPNTTQLTQPLDVSFFRPLKLFWNQLLIEWRIDNAGEALPRCEIAPLLQKAVEKMTNLSSILINGFRRSGLYPFDVEAVDYASLITTNNGEITSQQATSSFQLPTGYAEQANGDKRDFLHQLESYLSTEQLAAFQANLDAEQWTGDIQDQNLFSVWKMVKTGMTTEVDQPPIPDTAESAHPDEHNDSLSKEPTFEGFGDESLKDNTPDCATQSVPCTSNVINDANDQSNQGGPSTTSEPIDSHDCAAPNILGSSNRVDDILKMCFKKTIPKRTIKKPERIQPPSVATSKAYEDYVKKIETDKQNKENERQRKKDERSRKRKLKEAEKVKKKFDQFIKKKKMN